MHTAYLLVSYRLDLRDTAVDEQFRSRNVAAIVTGEKYRDLRDLIGCSESAFKSIVQVRANERTAAFVALYTLKLAIPLLAAIDAFRMIDPPSGISGSTFGTVKRRPLTLTLKSES